MYNLFLDDERNPNEFLKDLLAWVVVRNYNEFVTVVTERGLPGFVSFDHDLAEEHYASDDCSQFKHRTGLDCAKWLINHCLKTNQDLPKWQVHSMNPVGRLNIKHRLQDFPRIKAHYESANKGSEGENDAGNPCRTTS